MTNLRQSVMCRNLLAKPITPAAKSGHRNWLVLEFRGSCKKAIGFVRCVVGNTSTAEVDFLEVADNKWRTPEQSALNISAAIRDSNGLGCGDNRLKITSIGIANW